jgi:hypothetical protein
MISFKENEINHFDFKYQLFSIFLNIEFIKQFKMTSTNK